MTSITAGLHYTDLQFLGYPHIIATAVLTGADARAGIALVDPGPATTVSTLTAGLQALGIALSDVTDLLVTHIHLDHAGGTGQLVRANPRIRVHVHEAGAPHLVDPSRLISSASKLYGDDMGRLWGEILPVPADRLDVLRGGERITVAGRTIRVEYTPGHAKHHVSYLDEASGVAFVGDTLGIRRPPGSYVMPPAPPPDIDLGAWRASVARIMAWRPASVFLTHFGPYGDVPRHAEQFLTNLQDWEGKVRALLARAELSDAERCERFVEDVRAGLRTQMGPAEADGYERSGRVDYSWQGLARALSPR